GEEDENEGREEKGGAQTPGRSEHDGRPAAAGLGVEPDRREVTGPGWVHLI
ncbi:MAG: hypothetical protein RL091_2509, partial [Verrucomicrobiota bacterium]